MPRLYPVFLKLEHKTVLIVGGGRLARQKLRTLAPTGANVTLVAPEIAPECLWWPGRGCLQTIRRPFIAEDLDSADLVFAATGDSGFNHRVVGLARAAGILANAVDDPGYCDFFTPAVVRRGTVTLAVSSEGRIPGVTRAVRELLEEWLPERDDALIETLVAVRAELRGSRLDAAERATALRGLIARFRDEYLNPNGPAAAGRPARRYPVSTIQIPMRRRGAPKRFNKRSRTENTHHEAFQCPVEGTADGAHAGGDGPGDQHF